MIRHLPCSIEISQSKTTLDADTRFDAAVQTMDQIGTGGSAAVLGAALLVCSVHSRSYPMPSTPKADQRKDN
jgi:hypothetical protein